MQVVATLVHVAQLDGVADLDRAGIRLLLAHDHAEERRLARAVRPDDPHDPGLRQRERQPIDEELVAEALAQVLHFDDLVAEPRSGRDRDLELAFVGLVCARLGEQLARRRRAGPCPWIAAPEVTGAPIRARARGFAGERRWPSPRRPFEPASVPANWNSCPGTAGRDRGPVPGSIARRCRGSTGRG